jgi:hypothetical protein
LGVFALPNLIEYTCNAEVVVIPPLAYGHLQLGMYV